MTFKLGRIYVIIGFAVHFVTAQDPCDTAIQIGDDQRSVDNELAASATPIWDQSHINAGSWYRFDAHTGGKMAEGCVDFLHCGTIYTASLKTAGSHPTSVNQTVTSQVCVNDGEDCCSETHNIDIKMCNNGTDYYVYQLAILNRCHAAYCAGTGQPCPAGKIYLKAHSACLDAYPAMTGNPVMTGPFTPDSEWDPFWFTCTATYTRVYVGDDGARFRFKWYLDGVILNNTIYEVTGDSTHPEVSLYESYLTGAAGKYISCGVEAYWEDMASRSPMRTSNSYWIGITVPATGITLAQEDHEVEITISSTVPITGANCRFRDNKRMRDRFCRSYIFDFDADPYGNDLSRLAIAYSVTLSRGNRNANVIVIAKPAGGKMVPQHFVIQFEKHNMRQPSVWTDYTPPGIPIQVQNSVGMGVCRTSSHRIKTFDAKTYYNLYEPGIFLAVKSSARLFEVHLITRICSRRPSDSCSCGVAVREDNVVILVDNCNNGKFRTSKKVLSNNNPNVGLLTQDKTGTKMTILMPSGAKIRAEKDPNWHMNVYIELPSEDKYHVEGLCGSWDDNPTNDPSNGSRPRTFTESYRIPTGQSFFDGFPECENLDTTRVNLCTCDEGRNIPLCQAQSKTFFDRQFHDVCHTDQRRQKRQLDDFLKFLSDLVSFPNFQPIGDLTWPTASGITESEAEAACNAVIQQSSVYNSCAELQDFDITVEVHTCVADIQIADTTSVAESLLDVFETNCLDVARSNVIIGADNETKATNVVAAIQTKICPNHCFGHGTCFNSTCTCKAEFFGADCSVPYGEAPTVTDLYNHGLCDLSMEACDQIKVTAQPVIEGLICRWKIINDFNVETGEVMYTSSTLISSTNVFCSIPDLSSQTLSKFLLSIAVDGETFSANSAIAVYDSGCITCDDKAACTLLDGMCIMDDTCYEESVCGICKSAIDIGHPQRSPLYSTLPDDDVLCDVSRITPGYWYWFNAYTGNQMAETCPDLLQCGTLYPVWLSGAHPTANNPVAEGLLCGNTGLNLGDKSSCCDWNSTVNIRYCTDDSNDVYYVYQLPVLPFCNMAFCAGDREPCANGYAWNYENSQCEDINECASNPCVYGTCSNELNLFTCTCQEGYNGINCGTDAMDDCASSPCIHGSCNDLGTEYTCTCVYGYTGRNCEVNIDDCEGVYCNYGTCVDRTAGYTCTCESGYTGYHCEQVEYGVAPRVTGLYNQGLCDLSTETCDNMKVMAQPVIKGLICRWKILNNMDVETGKVIETKSTLISNTQVLCSIPELPSKTLSKFLLSIAVYRETFSVDYKITVYDSGCITCDVRATCTLLDGMCIVDDTCYEESVCGACESAIDIGHPQRSPLYNTLQDDDAMCDVSRITPGYWYWFNAYTGNQMAETCPDLLQCGTLYPVWLSGAHPTANNQVAEGLLCGNTGQKLGNKSSCCEWNSTVNIRYCTDDSNDVYYVYQLPVLPFCNMAFCAGDREPCSDGYAWNYENSQCKDIDECVSNPCVYGTCSNELNQFTCTCLEGYNGINCETDAIDECASSPCIHGLCNDLVTEYTCTCVYGYTGSNCEVDIDDCEGVDCNHGTCEDGTAQYKCTCDSGYTGYYCEKVEYGVAPTVTGLYNQGLCDLSTETCDKMKVTAQPVIKGLICRWKILNNSDVETGKVIETKSTLISNTQVLCSIPELPSQTLSKFLLSIAVYRESFSVDYKITVYDSGCITCDVRATCTVLDGMCIMDDTCYDESVCGACKSAIDIGHPQRSPLYNTLQDNDALCDVSRITQGYWYWFDAYTGNQMAETCPDLLQCGTRYPVWLSGAHPTANNQVAEGLLCCNTGRKLGDKSSCCDWNTTVIIRYCTDDSNDVYYVYQLPVLPFCNMAFCAGDREPCANGYAWNYENSQCKDIDECASNPCVYGTCSNELNQFTCTCQEGYNGINCETDVIDDCASSPCIHGSCNDLFAEYTCTCDDGYTGSNCEVDIDDCEGVDCNHGTCEDGTAGYTCTCKPGYTGYHCQQDTPNGTDFNINVNNLNKIKHEGGLKRVIANSVNEFCVLNLDTCCGDMGMREYNSCNHTMHVGAVCLRTQELGKIWLLTDPSLIKVHHGGPTTDNMYFKLTIFVNVSTEAALEVCVSHNSYPGIIPLGGNVITSSLEDTGIFMSPASTQTGQTPIQSSTVGSTHTGQTPTEGSTESSYVLIIGVACGAAGLLALIIIIVIIVIFWRSQSRMSVHSASLPTDIKPQSNKSVIYDNPSVVVDNVYQELNLPSQPPLSVYIEPMTSKAKDQEQE